MYQQVKKKAKAIITLHVMIVVVMFINFFVRRSYDDLDKTITSIYSDRLMPANYLFKINDHLYQKKLLLEEHETLNSSDQAQLDQHNGIIAALIKEYEATFLTKNEKEQWSGFKKELENYNHIEWVILQGKMKTADETQLQTSFNLAKLHLKQLNEIQATEGKLLEVHSRRVIGESRLNAWLEISLLFVLSIALLQLTGFNEKYKRTDVSTAALN